MSLFTSSYLKGVYSQNQGVVSNTIRLYANSPQTVTFDIFLSHSFLDRDEVLGLYFELTKRGFSVYVDWIVDPHLDRNNVTKESAELIRKRMHSSRTLLLAISHNASVSKWMPWELGFIDGHTGFCAIAPISKDNQTRYSYKGVEYLSLYPYISFQKDSDGDPRLWVFEEDDLYIVLEAWVRQKSRPFRHTL